LVPLFRGDLLLALILLIANVFTVGIGGMIFAFFYDKSYTLGLIERGYEFADNETTVELACGKLGIALPARASTQDAAKKAA